MNSTDTTGESIARALGVDISPGQRVASIELFLKPGEAPMLRVTRYVGDEAAQAIQELGLMAVECYPSAR